MNNCIVKTTKRISMKKYILLLMIFTLTIPLFAQLEVKEGSFKEVPGFVNINPDDNYQTDDNNLPFAVIKVRTENINDKQRRELKFSGNAGTFIMLEYKDGEVWVYLTAQYADYLKISHPDFSSIEFTLPYDLKPKCGYEMALVNKAEVISNGWASLTITTSPENGAEISLNGRPLNQTTPYTNNMIPAGKYEITVSKFGFENVTKTIVINEGESTNFEIEMPYKYGSLSIVSNPSEAIVYIDDVECGITPLTINNIKYGTHELKIKKNCLRTYKEQIIINDDNLIAINIVMENCPEGAIDGLFSVSENKHVYFSKGNLQYNIRKKKWQFAESQWDYIGKKNEKKLSNCIDLFMWGTGDNPNKPSNKIDHSTFNEWGNNAISNGGNQQNLWRTLTNQEWDYILNTRSTISGIRYAKAQVNGINGIIILPDNWNNDIYKLKNTNLKNSSYNDNIISSNIWINCFENNGSIFLPAAGELIGVIAVIGDGSDGYYHSSTSSLSSSYFHYGVHFSNVSMDSNDGINSNDNGYSVRLVCDVE